MKSIAEIVRHPSSTGSTLIAAADVSMDDLHFEAAIKGELLKKQIANRTLEVDLMLSLLLAKAKLAAAVGPRCRHKWAAVPQYPSSLWRWNVGGP